MENLFGEIYNWFQSLFGQDLSYYLWGYDPITGAYTNSNLYNFIGLITVFISLITVLLYYYVFSHPKYSKWWTWLLTLLVNGGVALFIGYGIVYSKYINGFIPEELLCQRDPDGTVTYLINDLNCWGFGIANIFVAIILFFVLTFVFKWWSRDAKHVPF